MARPLLFPPSKSLTGIQQFRSRDLVELLKWTGVDVADDDTGWVLIATDLHVSNTGLVDTFDPRIGVCIDNLSAAPDAVLILGDYNTQLCGSFGSPLDATAAAAEVGWSNTEMAVFTNLAPTYCILGNHDTFPEESPLGNYMLANSTYFTAINSNVTIGGVKFVMLSTSHDAGFVDGQDTYLATELGTLTAGQECVVGIHQPGGGVAYDWHAFYRFCEVADAITNPLWQISGHDHRYSDSTVQLGGTTIAKWLIGSGQSGVSGDETKPTMAAMACRDGEVVGRYFVDLKDGYWYALKPHERAGAVNPPEILLGLGATPALSLYQEGDYDRTGRFNNAAAQSGSYRIAGTWLAYCANVQVTFPIPAGATKFFVVITVAPLTVEMSNTHSAYQAVSIPALVNSILILDIPVGLQGGSDLHVKITTAGSHISHWGFA